MDHDHLNKFSIYMKFEENQPGGDGREVQRCCLNVWTVRQTNGRWMASDPNSSS